MKSFPKLFLFFLMINQYLYSADTQINNPHINNFQIKVITYNLMCDYCHYFDEDFLPFRERFNLQIDLISKQKPDLIALQEIRTKNQVDEILARLGPNYQAIYFSNSFLFQKHKIKKMSIISKYCSYKNFLFIFH